MGEEDSNIFNDEDISQTASWSKTNIAVDSSEPLLNRLEEYNVFFSAPLDIDFLMLQHYEIYYQNTLSPKEGPSISYTNQDKETKKVKITDVDKTNELQQGSFEERKNEAVRATLKNMGGQGDSFTEEEKKLMIWYQYFFLGRGKPTSHMRFLSSISDDELKASIPQIFNRIVERAEELLGE